MYRRRTFDVGIMKTSYNQLMKKEISIMRKKFFEILNIIVYYLARSSVNCTCVWIHYQPKIPEELKNDR